jgi:AcrR family transcriptional regulator
MPHRPDQEQLRQKMEATSNVRARKTRAKLVAAYQELTEESHHRVTVGDVVRQAKVNRTTFYAHFESIEALAVEAFADLAETITSEHLRRRADGGRREPSLASLEETLHYVAERRELYLELLGHGSTPFFNAIEDAFALRTAGLLRTIGALPDDRDVEVAARFIAAGTVGVIAQWLRDGMNEDPDLLAERLLNLLPPYFSQDAPS